MIALTMTAYDTAGAANRGAMASLLQFVTASHILFGTDFPPGDTSQEIARQLAQLGMFDQNALRAIDRENAVTLLPRLKAAAVLETDGEWLRRLQALRRAA